MESERVAVKYFLSEDLYACLCYFAGVLPIYVILLVYVTFLEKYTQSMFILDIFHQTTY
jgi:hypothetical protein